MKHYRLVYKQPHEYDDDSPSGIGDHQVGYIPQTAEFQASNDADARSRARSLLMGGGIDFGVHVGSPPAGYYPRQFISLKEFVPDRVVEMKE